MTITDPLLSPLPGAEHREIGGVHLDIVRAGDARVKRMIFHPGFRWSKEMKPVAGTEQCMHAHVGFLAHGQIQVEYPDGCTQEFRAPDVLIISPGHDAWVVGQEPAIVIEFDFEGETVERLGMPATHNHSV